MEGPRLLRSESDDDDKTTKQLASCTGADHDDVPKVYH